MKWTIINSKDFEVIPTREDLYNDYNKGKITKRQLGEGLTYHAHRLIDETHRKIRKEIK